MSSGALVVARPSPGLIGRLRRRPAGEALIPPFEAAMPSVILSAGLVALVMILAAAFFDAAAMGWLQDLPHVVEVFFQRITDFGKSAWELYPSAAIVLVLAAGDWRHEPLLIRLVWLQVGRLSGYVFIAVATSGILVNIAKPIIGRARPTLYEQLGPFGFEPFTFGYKFASFPSGHATTVGATVMAFSLITPRWRPHLLVTGIIIASSRVFVGAHYPSDVVCGVLFGGLCAYAVAARMARDGFVFSRSRDDSIRARTAVFRRAASRQGGLAAVMAGPWRALVRRAMPKSN